MLQQVFSSVKLQLQFVESMLAVPMMVQSAVCTSFSGAYASQSSWWEHMHCNVGMAVLYRLERQELNPHRGSKLGFTEGFSDHSTLA
jgi:hypothetical protein